MAGKQRKNCGAVHPDHPEITCVVAYGHGADHEAWLNDEVITRPLRPLASEALEAALAELTALENEVATLAETMAEKRAQAKHVGETVIPDLLETEHLNDGARLRDGREYTFERDLHCGIAKDRKTEAFEFLADRNADGMLKRYVTIGFGANSKLKVQVFRSALARLLPEFEVGIKVGRAPGELVDSLKALLAAADLNVTVEDAVELPGATLASFVRKEMKAGRTLPDCFGVYAPMRAIPVVPPAPKDDATQAERLMTQLEGSVWIRSTASAVAITSTTGTIRSG